MISLFINELPTLTAFSDGDKLIVDSTFTQAAQMSTVRDYVFSSAVVPSMTATNLIVTSLSALSATLITVDVINYELSGFEVKGEITITPNDVDQYALRSNTTTGAITLPVGTAGQRPNPAIQGALRFNTGDNAFEGYNGTEWGALGETVLDRFVDVAAGNIEIGAIVPKGTSLQDLVNTMFTKTYFPTKEEPSASTSLTLASIVEAGTQGLTITISYNDGRILGQTIAPPGVWSPPSNVSGVWSPSLVQSNNPYAGAATLYTINGTNNGLTNNLNLPSQQIVDGVNTFNSSVGFAQGPVPYDSKGGDYSASLPRKAAGTVNTSGNITGARKVWYGLNLVTINETNIRAYGNFKWSTSNAASIETIVITIPAGATNVFFAVPNDVTRTPIVNESVLNVDIFAAFVNAPTLVRGAGTTPYTGSRSNYNVWRFQPVTVFDQEVTYTITI